MYICIYIEIYIYVSRHPHDTNQHVQASTMAKHGPMQITLSPCMYTNELNKGKDPTKKRLQLLKSMCSIQCFERALQPADSERNTQTWCPTRATCIPVQSR